MRSAERRKLHVLEMKCLRSLVGVSRMDRVSNEDVQRKAGIERELTSRTDQRVLRWIGLVERMDEYRVARRVLMADICGGRVRGEDCLGRQRDDGGGCGTKNRWLNKSLRKNRVCQFIFNMLTVTNHCFDLYIFRPCLVNEHKYINYSEITNSPYSLFRQNIRISQFE